MPSRPRIRRIAGNIFSNWVALVLGMVVAFFLMPFVVHHLGNVAYGVWVLVVSLNSYMGLLDLGLRGAVTRFVSKGATQGNHDESSEAASGALWIRLWLSIAILLTSIGFASVFTRLFQVPPSLAWDARWAILATAAGLAITLCSGVFGGILAALHRFELLSTVSITQNLLRAGGIVVLLEYHHGILALALWELTTTVVASCLQIYLCFHGYSELRIHLGTPSRVILRKLWGYSFYVFVINVALQLVYYTDNLVVGAFVSAAGVTFYAIGGTLVGYARQVVGSMTTTFTPLASTFEAEGSERSLRQLLIHGTRAALIVSLPIELALFLRGETFINLWMGAEYAHSSGTVLRVLLISLIVSTGSAAACGIVYGMEKHRRVALWGILEGAANLTLSIFLVRRIGIYGVAWGTTIPSVFVELFLWPPFVCGLVAISIRRYLWQTWGRTGLAVLPFTLACYLTERFWPVHSLPWFFTQIAAVLPLFALGLAVMYRKEIMTIWRARAKSAAPTPELVAVPVRNE
jgi:O-antigen/teichoic acid export membrane protein